MAVGWDHPDDLSIMLSTAAKSYYLLAWLEHLQTHGKGSKHLDISQALRVNFTPVMHSPLAD